MKKILFLILMFPALSYSQVAKHNGGMGYSQGDARYVNVTGNESMSGNLLIGGTLGVTGLVTATVATAAQPNITSVGTLTNLVISKTGDVGITINAPDVLTPYIKFKGEGFNKWDIGVERVTPIHGAGPRDFFIYDYLGTAGSRFIVKSTTGYIGIGVSNPDQKLTVAGNISTTGQIISSGTGNNYFAGNVGIGTTNPGVALEIGTTGKLKPGGDTLANLLLYNPVAAGEIAICTNCTVNVVCVSSSAYPNSMVDPTDKAVACH